MNSLDILRAKALAVCVRGNAKPSATLGGWQGGEDTIHLVESLTDRALGRRVHLFADQHTVGWETVIGDANWREGGTA